VRCCGMKRKFVRVSPRANGNPVMTFPIKKRTNVELFIDRTVVLIYERLGSEL